MTPRTQDGVLIGNQLDKSAVANPLMKRMIANFDAAVLDFATDLSPRPASVHEVGCGEGRLSSLLRDRLGAPMRASDFSRELIAEAELRGDERIQYVTRSIYDLDRGQDSAELIVCCEVLEHLERPAEGLAALRRLEARRFVLSVPREPLWRVLNFVRGRYVPALGNTPGHLNHWSAAGFARFLAKGGFEIERMRQPLPWTVVCGRFCTGPE